MTGGYLGFLLNRADLPPLEKVLKESAPAPAGGSPHSTHYSGERAIAAHDKIA